jgi:UDP-glucose 4-epimerase
MSKFDKKNIIITGGCGFIGSHLLKKLLSLNVGKVVVIDSMQYGESAEDEYRDERVIVLKHNIGIDPVQNIEPYFADSHIVYHLAAQKHNQSLADLQSLYVQNIFGTQQIFDLAGKYGITDVIFSSSLYAHGSYHNAKMSEADVPEPRTSYGISKLAGEHLLKMCAAQYGYHHTALRFFFVYGSRQYPGRGYKSVIVKNFERLKQQLPPIIFGDGQQKLDYVHVSDVVEAMVLVVEKEITGEVLHIGSGQSISILDLTKTMVDVVGSEASYVYEAPDTTAGTVRGTGTEKAEKVLGWRAKVQLYDGLVETFNWLKTYEKQ